MLDLERIDNWPERLFAVLDEHRSHDFQWGKWDCATLMRDAVIATTGSDPFAGIWPSHGYRSRLGAIKAIRAAGYDGMVALTKSRFPSIHKVQAQRGDLVFGEVDSPVTSPAICVGAEMVTRDFELGWVVLPMSQATMAFRVG
jgi:hypothetical protein